MSKRIPVIRGKIGDWIYYVGVLSFTSIYENVKKIDEELHKSEGLKDAIQRSITENYKAIKDYLLNQEERFFNAIVLAVYEGNPNYVEVEMEFQDEEFNDIGYLILSGEEKIFPVDGQHRVEGIKAAIDDDVALGNEKVPVIFIGHQNTPEGMQRTRRLFSTLNRYAKPVSQKDIIALDEDDIVAIITRDLVDEHDLFVGNRVILSQQKNIPDANKTAFTSLTTLAQCNDELLKYYFSFFKMTENAREYKEKYYSEKNRLTPNLLRRFRPKNETLVEFKTFCMNYWNSVATLDFLEDFVAMDCQPHEYRNRENGGNILFRPIGLLPFVQATLDYASTLNPSSLNEINFDRVLEPFRSINFSLTQKPWKYIAWDPTTNTIITQSNKKLLRYLFSYMSNSQIEFTEKQMEEMKKSYASFIVYEGELADVSMDHLLSTRD